MKIIVRLLLMAIILIFVAYFAAFIFVNMKGEEIIKENIKKNFGLEAEIGSFSLRIPFTVVIESFDCGDVSFDKANVALESFNPFTSRIILSKIFVDGLKAKAKIEDGKFKIKPFLDLEVRQINERAFSGIKIELIPEALAAAEAGKRMVPFTIRSCYLKDATVQLICSLTNRSFDFSATDADLKIKNFNFPKLSRFYLNVVANLFAGNIEMKDALQADGWIDYANKAMDFKLSLKDINYFAFSEYYPPFWKPDNLRIKEAYLSLISDLNSKNNDLVIDSVLTVEKIEFKEEETEEDALSRIKTLKTVLVFLKGAKDKPSLHFKLKTKMDLPKLDFSSIKESFKEVVPIAPADIIAGVIGEVKDKVSEAVEKVKEITPETAEETIKDILGNFKDIFKKKPDSEE